VLRVNLWGVFWMCKHALPHLLVDGGSIVNISSNSAERSVPGLPTYEATKGAMNVLTRSIAVDYGTRGVRCNTVSLGLIVSHYMTAGANDPDILRAFGGHTLVGRGGSPDDVANAVAFLASDEASYITGALLHVDGGSSARSPASPTVLDAMMRPGVLPANLTD
jgi:meso-butanediol dehydrogenase / (S,S)-butanediol dehydrogenase / diacetyl reductase